MLKEKNLSEKEDALLKKQFEELERHRIELQEKGSEKEEEVMKAMKEKDELLSKKVAIKDILLELEGEEEQIEEDMVKVEEWKQ